MAEDTMIYRGRVEDGAMIDAPAYESHRRGKNWMAVITAAPAAPGGFARAFVPRGNGRYYYIVSSELIGKAVEFGADYTSSGGSRKPRRWYGVVLSVTADAITIQQYEEGYRAIEAARTAEAAATSRENAEHTRFESIEFQPDAQEIVKEKREDPRATTLRDIQGFVQWLYREEEITLTLQNGNRDNLDERAAVALVDRYLMRPEDLKREREKTDSIIRQTIEKMREQGRYHDL